MQRTSRPESLDLRPGQMQRSQSVSSDRTSISTAPSLTSPPPVVPDPAYIAASAASQIVTSDHQSQVDDWFHRDDGKEELDAIAVSPASLTLVNGFLDYLLFSILAISRSTSIASLRPAVAEVLKPRLAKDAIDGADQELKEFLGGGDAEELSVFHKGQHQPRGKWDLSLVWRRTRLRCMVYTRLGDMEEEDEEMYIEQEFREHATNGDRRISRELALVSPAAAIFLTSILEFIGEHALMVAGEAASNRMDIRRHRDETPTSTAPTEIPRLAVEDIDVEKLAFNTTLGRLWRSWKKRVRVSSLSGSRPLSREIVRRRAASVSASPSMGEVEDPIGLPETGPRPSVSEVLEEEQESAKTPRDMGGEAGPDEPELELRAVARLEVKVGNRPHSMMVYVQSSVDPPLTPLILSRPPSRSHDTRSRPGVPERRKRSASLPTLRVAPEFPLGKETIVEPHDAPAEVGLPVDRAEPQVDEPLPSGPENARLPSEDETRFDADDMVPPDANGEPVDLGTLSGFTGSPPSQEIRGTNMAVPGMRSFRVDRGRESLTKPPAELEAPIDWPIREHAEKASATTELVDSSAGEEIAPLGEKRPRSRQKTEAAEVDETSRAQEDRELHPSRLYAGWTSELEWKRHLKSLQKIPPSPLAVIHGDPSLVQAKADVDGPRQTLISVPQQPQAAADPRSNVVNSEATQPPLDVDSHELRQVPPNAAAHPLGAEYGATSMTPLRDTIDTDGDLTDRLVSPTPSYHGPNREKTSPKPSLDHNPDSEILYPLLSSQSKLGRASRADESTHRQNISPSVDTSGPERAAVQRINPSPKEQNVPNRTSTSSNREFRPPTATSGASQLSQKVKGFIGRESIDTVSRQSARRDSSAGSESVVGEREPTNTSVALLKQESFEKLIRSDETIQYTLTPRNVRDLENNSSSKLNLRQAPAKSRGTDPHNFEPASLIPRTSIPSAHSITPMKNPGGLRSHPVGGAHLKDAGDDRSSSSSLDVFQTTSRTLKGTVHIDGHKARHSHGLSNGKPGDVVPRDARAKKETTSEIADFIRSTGPEPMRQIPSGDKRAGLEPLRPSPSKSISSNAIIVEPSNSETIKKPHVSVLPKTSGTASSKRPGPRLQARDPTVSHDNQTSDLIDFIRQGPVLDRTDGSRRIPRSVAPFRRTMDSDEIQSLGNGKAKDASSVTSTQDGVAPTQSLRSSSNSRTGLLESTKRWNNGQNHATSKPFRLDEAPRRKQHRGRDPYAIDIEGEDEEGSNLTAEPAAHEETLVEFLRSMSPSKQGPTISGSDGARETGKKPVTKESSGQNTREQFSKASTSSVHPTKTFVSKPTISDMTSARVSRGREKSRQTPPVSPLDPSPHRVTANGTGNHQPRRPTNATPADRNHTTLRHARLQPRGEREAEPGLSELADFFKNSGPPTPPLERSPSGPIVGREKEDGSFSRLFRRKKSAAKL